MQDNLTPRRLLGLLLLLVASLPELSAQEDPEPRNSAEIVHRWADSVAAELEMNVKGAAEPCKLKGRSLIRWSNPIVGEVYGDCYLWTRDELPVAFMSVYAFLKPENKRRVTLQSLCEQPIEAKRNGVVVWAPLKAGFSWLELDGIPKPKPTRLLRQRQMRMLASTFKAVITEKDASESWRELRLLSKPLHQYGVAAPVEGALFAFVDGTDPELLLRIEYRNDRFELAAIRQNHRALQLRRMSLPIWEAQSIAPPFPNPNISDPEGVYYNTKWSTIEALSGEEGAGESGS